MKILGNKLIVECTTYDFKEELERQKIGKWLKAVSAYADTNGGALYFGVNDNAEIVGLKNAQSDAEFISETINSHLDPIPNYTLTPDETEDGKIVLELMIPEGNQTPYYLNLDGRKLAYVRAGNESIPATSHQLFNLVLKGSNRSWDSLVTTEKREKHTFAYLANEFHLRTGAQWEDSLLISFGLVTEDGYLTNAGLLFSDMCPVKQSRLYCTKWDGIEKDNSINDSEYQGNILMLLNHAKNFIKSNTAVPWFKLPDYRLNLPEYSERAIEEMCVNHLIHRDYTELGAEVAINIYDDRIETTSPGGSKDAPELTPVDPFNTASYRRNPIVAEVFAQLKYMEKRGSGLKKIINTTSMLPTYKDDKKPYFRSSRSFFFTTIPNVNYGMNRTDLEAFADSKVPEPEYRPEDEIVIGKTYPINAEPTQKTYPINAEPTQKTYPINSVQRTKPIGKTAQEVLDILVSMPHANRAEIANAIGKSEDTVKLHIGNLQKKGIIERVGSNKNGYWKVLIKK